MIQTTVNGLTTAVLGQCGEFEEKQIGAERFNLFKICPNVNYLFTFHFLNIQFKI